MKTLSAGLAAAIALFGSAAQADTSQLIAHLGLTAEEAATLTLSEIVAMKFNRDASHDDQQSVRPALPATARTFLPVWHDGDDH